VTFERIMEQLSARSVFLDHLGQIQDGKVWSARVRKKGSTSVGYGQGKTIKDAVRAALENTRDSFDPNPRGKKKRQRASL